MAVIIDPTQTAFNPFPTPTPIPGGPIPTGVASPTGAIAAITPTGVTNLFSGFSWGRLLVGVIGLILIVGGIALLLGEDIASAVGKVAKAAAV